MTAILQRKVLRKCAESVILCAGVVQMNGKLRYASAGARNYHDYPVPTHARRVWEVQYVHGPAVPRFLIGQAERGVEYIAGRDTDASPVSGRALWVFNPLTAHGWESESTGRSEVAVFHVDSVSPAVAEVLGNRPWIAVRWREDRFLDRASRWLQEEASDLSLPIANGREMGAPDEFRVAAIHELIASMVTYAYGGVQPGDIPGSQYGAPGEADGPAPVTAGDTAAARLGATTYRLERGEAWFEAHMHEGAGVADTARAVGTSIRHLTRLSQKHRGVSFGRVLHTRRMARANWMLRSSAQPVFEIAAACGYQNQSAFTRAVHRFFGRTPLELREEAALHRPPTPELPSAQPVPRKDPGSSWQSPSS